MKRIITRVLGVVLLLGVLAGLGVWLAPPLDIRPAAMGEGTPADASRRARELIDALPEAYGGMERWRSARATRVVLTDFWPDGLLKTMACPWRDGEKLDLTYLNGRDTGRLAFHDSDRDGDVWGIQHWMTYTARPSASPVFEQDDTVKFWLPTIQYFMELPFRIVEADVVEYAGARSHAGHTYDLVYATWGTAEPQDDIDQYVLWINRESGMLDYIRYTVRDMGKFIEGTMHCEDFRQVGGLTFPFRMSVGGTVEEPETMHRFDLESVELLPELAEATLIVAPDRRGAKHGQ